MAAADPSTTARRSRTAPGAAAARCPHTPQDGLR
jgi:hypothetical protein